MPTPSARRAGNRRPILEHPIGHQVVRLHSLSPVLKIRNVKHNNLSLRSVCGLGRIFIGKSSKMGYDFGES